VDDCEADDTGNGTACCTCPTGATCAVGSTIETIKVNQKYYRHGTQTPQVLKCLQKQACIGDPVGDDDEVERNPCAEGFAGALCRYLLEARRNVCLSINIIRWVCEFK